MADSFIKTAANLDKLATLEKDERLQKVLLKVRWISRFRDLTICSQMSETMENSRKLEAKSAADEDLKESDTLRYFMKDTNAAKVGFFSSNSEKFLKREQDLLYRRLRCLANYEAANKALERARAKNKDVAKAEHDQQEACAKFERISEVAKVDLQTFKQRRVAAFKKNLVDLAELELKHARAHMLLWKNTCDTFEEKTATAE
jgi:sorting nexin-5/6/32